jgi:hypothetical protein
VQGSRIIRDPFGADAIQSAFDPDAGKLLQQAQEDGDMDRIETPLWWLSKREDGVQILHATLSDPSTSSA